MTVVRREQGYARRPGQPAETKRPKGPDLKTQQAPSPADFRDRVQLITYLPPCGHHVRLQYDLDESEDPSEEWIFCRSCRQSYCYFVCKKVLPQAGNRVDGAKRIAQNMDDAIIRNRVARLLSCEERLTWDLARLIAGIVGCSPRLVWQVERDMWSYAEWQH